MKINKNLQNASLRITNSQSSNPITATKQNLHLNVSRAERSLLQRSRKEMDTARVRRSPIERMSKIHRLIADQKFPNAVQLAQELEVGHKTICRDIEYMRDHYSFPIEYDFAERGYYYTRPVDGFPGAAGMTEREISAIHVAHKAVAQYKGAPFHHPLQMALQKLCGQLDSKERCSVEDSGDAFSFRPFAPEDTDPHLVEIVTRARKDRKVLEFAYRKPGTQESALRRVHPYDLICCDNRWYLLALDEGRADVRTFALGRMEKPVLCQEQFTRPLGFDPLKYLQGSFSVMKGEGDYVVEIEFDAWATDHLRGRRWHSTQQIEFLPDGSSRLRMRLTELEEVKRWVLSWGTHATVIAPTQLIERLSATINQLSSRYPVPPLTN